ncbi:MAG: tyrosine-protein phosphatase [Neisseria animaloris]|nr:tyrosine-protein phosphatase [Neisseria animaloris]
MKKRIILAALLLMSMNTFAGQMPAESAGQNAAEWAQLVDKEANFYRIDEKFYRSEQLFHSEDAALLERENIRTIINLRFFDRNDDEQAFGKTRFKLVNMPLMSWAISPKDVAKVLWQIEQAQQNGAVLVHCYHGADRTGLISAMYRILYQGWPAEEARREMIEGPYGFHSVWRNIKGFFTEKNIAATREALDKLRAAQAKAR